MILLPEGRALAGMIFQQQPFNVSAPVVPGNSVGGGSLVLLDRFDASSGTLDSVEVGISGRLTLNASLPSNFIDLGPGGVIPGPYSYSFQIEQSLQGFTFLSQPTLSLSGSGVIGPEAFVATYDYSYSFIFDATSDLTGFAPVTTSDTFLASRGTATAIPPIGAVGDRGDFSALVPGVPLPIIPVLELDTILFDGYNGSGGPPSGLVSSVGSVALTYHFTDPVTTLSEPAALFAMLFGLMAFCFARRGFDTASQRLQ